MSAKPPPRPPYRAHTVRETLRDALLEGPRTARDLSARAGIREREVTYHLAHWPCRSRRIACGYVFRSRTRLSRPSACPRCRSTHIDSPTFSIERHGG